MNVLSHVYLFSQHAALVRLTAILRDSTAPPPSLPPFLLSLLTSLPPPSTQLASELLAMVIHCCSLFVSAFTQMNQLFKAVQSLLCLHPLPLPLAMAASQLLQACGHLRVPQQATKVSESIYHER